VLGVIFSLLGGSATIIRIAAGKIGGFIVIIMGLKLLNIINIPFLDYEKRLDTQPDKYQPLLSSFVLGVIFSAGWSPCIGPVLGSILMIVLNHGDLQVGIILLTSYSLGLAIPFIILSLFWDSVFKYLKRIAIVTRYIDLISGIILVIIGIMLILGLFQQLSSFGTFLNL
jgi:cytochrome c-type biogenesis protein